MRTNSRGFRTAPIIIALGLLINRMALIHGRCIRPQPRFGLARQTTMIPQPFRSVRLETTIPVNVLPSTVEHTILTSELGTPEPPSSPTVPIGSTEVPVTILSPSADSSSTVHTLRPSDGPSTTDNLTSESDTTTSPTSDSTFSTVASDQSGTPSASILDTPEPRPTSSMLSVVENTTTTPGIQPTFGTVAGSTQLTSTPPATVTTSFEQTSLQTTVGSPVGISIMLTSTVVIGSTATTLVTPAASTPLPLDTTTGRETPISTKRTVVPSTAGSTATTKLVATTQSLSKLLTDIIKYLSIQTTTSASQTPYTKAFTTISSSPSTKSTKRR